MPEELYYRNTVIGEMPDGWDKAPINNQLVSIQSGFACAKKHAVSNGLPHLRPFNVTTDGEVVITSDTVEIPNDFREDLESYYLRSGDVLFNNTNSVELVGKTGIVRQPMQVAFSNHVYRLRVRNPERIDSRWLALALRHLQKRGFFATHCRKWIGQAGFNQTELAQVEIPLPSVQEQRRIVTRTEALLVEVREMRKLQAGIAVEAEHLMRAVLREEFEQIGSIAPSDKRISEITSVSSGGTPLRSRAEFYQGTIPWIKTGELKDNIVTEAEEHITDEALQNSNAKLFPINTILIAMYGQGQTRGRTGILGIEAATNQACCAIYPNPELFDSRYLQFWFRHMYTELRQQSEARGGNQPNLNQRIIKSLNPPLPDTNEQRRYVAYFEGIEAEISEMFSIERENRRVVTILENAILEQAIQGEL